MKRSAWRYLWTSEDIRKKLLITVLLLVIYRLAANIPVPGINREVIRSISEMGGPGASLFNLLDLLSGGTISNFSILAMGVYPYITSQIIIQLLVPIIPALDRRLKDNPREGRSLMEKWTTMLTIPMAFLSAIGQVNIFNSMAKTGSVLTTPFGFVGASLLPTITLLLSMVAGTMFGIWLGQLISEFGIPNQGLSLIIFAGIISKIPSNLLGILADKENGWWVLIIILVLLALTIFAIVYVQQGRRNVPVLFPGRRIGNRMSMPVRSNLPLMVNMAGMIPLIFAQTFLSFPALIASYFIAGKTSGFWYGVYSLFSGSGWFYPIIFFVLVVAFTFFYTDVLFTQQNYGDTLKKQGAQIPGVVRGGPTQKYLTRVQRRITFPGAFFLGFVAVLPYIIGTILPITRASAFVISAAGLLIVVGVVRDTFTIIETELKVHGYDESIIKG
ncbi:MAG TPA: preprotein translocase subunit SecY [Anaerolineaceae bacterium]|jgi:preprotein translocase subunit SecY|nr:preprotein translocase subunit SecY [Anaerolineaceae bacterium]NMC17159.1 preprotein translocase subunit SecY [Chloroflexota bacterium]HNS07671.1 preprotein translocase subunit SecY [Anaerolineaceae bacterium]HOE01940.1 preprotein translocase subunit SecY [Anaerolineaceae bacterium]HOQ69782.1 preprotein translocase subunit SecY [Anaerolineaceae bacterium]